MVLAALVASEQVEPVVLGRVVQAASAPVEQAALVRAALVASAQEEPVVLALAEQAALGRGAPVVWVPVVVAAWGLVAEVAVARCC